MNCKRVKNSNGKQIILISDYNLSQVQDYYDNMHMQVSIAEYYNPSAEEVLHAIPLFL